MGGEYLPDCTAGETEIARIELESTLADVTSIRAKREGDEYRYSIVDEHGDTYSLQTETSELPFSLDELVDFIDYSEQTEDGQEGYLFLTTMLMLTLCLASDYDTSLGSVQKPTLNLKNIMKMYFQTG